MIGIPTIFAVLFAVAQPPSVSMRAGAPTAHYETNPYAQEIKNALADARRIGEPEASVTRYLSFNNPEWTQKQRDDAKITIDHWVNALSRRVELVKPRRVGTTLLAVRFTDYGWDDAVYSRLADADPWYHVQLTFQINTVGRRYFEREKGSKAGWYDANFLATKTVAALAPWLPPTETAELVALTNSPTPLLRADWFLSQTAIQFNRKAGYYDFLGFKTLADFDKTIKFNRKDSQQIEREIAAIVSRSGVSNFPRQIFREQSLTGGRWETRDVITDNVNERNALRQLDGDYKPEAFEIYGTLPNGLFAFFLADGKGNRQDSAPDGVGADKTAPGNDGKIHIGLSCVRCHTEGLRPIGDWARKAYAPPNALTSPDPAKHLRLVQIYLGELGEWYEGDNAFYAQKLKRLTGWKPDELAKQMGRLWAGYQERDWLPNDIARDVGMDEKTYLMKLVEYRKANQLSDPILAAHLANPAIPIRADDIEQLTPLLYPILLGTPK